MKTFLWTCDQYVDIVANHAKLHNMMGGKDIEVTVLGFKEPTVEYPSNYVFQSMGNQDDFQKGCWSEPIRPFIEEIEEDYFGGGWWDDNFPVCSFDMKLYNEAIELVKSKKVQKIHFFFGSDKQYALSEKYNDNFNALSQTAQYRTGLVPGIWSKEYFLKYLGQDMSPWDYEVKNMEATINDGATILVPRHTPIVGWVNMFRHGKFNDAMWNNYLKSPTGHFAWNEFQKLTPEVAEIVGSYQGAQL